MNIDLTKIGFFYQSANNPCAVEMNFRQIKKYYPNSPVVLWEDISNNCKPICENYNIPYKRVYRLSEDTTFHRSQPVTEVSGGLRYLNRIYVTLMNELKDVDWFIHMEDDVWVKGPIEELPTTPWSGCFGGLWDEPLMEHFKNDLGMEPIECYHGACGATIISRQSFIESYLKIQDIDWLEVSKLDKYIGRYSDAIISYLLLFNKIKWSPWSQWSQGGYEDFKVYNKPFVHNIKYWYNHSLSKLDEVNSSDNVKFFLEHNS